MVRRGVTSGIRGRVGFPVDQHRLGGVTIRFRRRPLIWLALVVLVLGACSSEKALPEPVEVDTCEGLEDVGVQLVEVWVEVVDQIPYDDLLTDPPPPEIEELARIGSDLDDRATRLSCDAVALNEAILARVTENDRIDPETPVGALLLDLVQEGLVGSLPIRSAPQPATTVSP